MEVKHRTGEYKPCGYCKKELWCSPSRLKNYSMRFCSKEHLHLYQKSKSFSMVCSICNNTFFTQPAQVKYRNRITCSRKCRGVHRANEAEKRRESGVMTKHQIDRAERYSKKAEDWRKAIFERDNYTCQICGIRGTYLEADHIKPFAYFKDLRYELSNGRTLCRPCHDTTKISAKKMKEIYGNIKTI